MPLPVPCNSRITEVRDLGYAEFCCLGDPRYYVPLRLPPHRPGFRFGLIPGILPPLSTSRTGAVGPPLLTDRPSVLAVSFTPERFRAAPESRARTAVFAQKCRARPARSLTGCSFDAAEFTFVAACSYAPPRFDADLSIDAGEFASPLLWRLAGAGLTPADRSALCWAHYFSNLAHAPCMLLLR
jgi:hypothetical protein